jgi:hypothetical protein
MERSLELFDRHADEVFEYFRRSGNGRMEALHLTEEYFLTISGVYTAKPASLPAQKPLLRPYFNVVKYLMKFSS